MSLKGGGAEGYRSVQLTPSGSSWEPHTYVRCLNSPPRLFIIITFFCTRIMSSPGRHLLASALAAGDEVDVIALEAREPGQLYTWGRNTDGQLGQDRVCLPPSSHDLACALPFPIPGLHEIIDCACGTGAQGCTFAVAVSGELYAFGNNSKSRLGLGTRERAIRIPTQVRIPVAITRVACDFHTLALDDAGTLWAWGVNGGNGCLGLVGVANDAIVTSPTPIPRFTTHAIVAIGACNEASAALDSTGALFMWGSAGGKGRNRLGLGDPARDTGTPTALIGIPPVVGLDIGSLYTAAWCVDGSLYTWGYGGAANLGHGNVESVSLPTRVEWFAERGVHIIHCACTVGEDHPKGQIKRHASKSNQGKEGPHTHAVDSVGNLYSFGSSHKGLLCNLAMKSLAVGSGWDESLPYLVTKSSGAPTALFPPRPDSRPADTDSKGGKRRRRLYHETTGLRGPHNATRAPSDWALQPGTDYSHGMGPIISAASFHISAMCVGADGRLWAWGCGSNEGRCGVERFLSSNGRQYKPSKMKCYMHCPHQAGVCHDWAFKGSKGEWPRREMGANGPLDGVRVLRMAASRNHAVCIGVRE